MATKVNIYLLDNLRFSLNHFPPEEVAILFEAHTPAQTEQRLHKKQLDPFLSYSIIFRKGKKIMKIFW